MKLKRCLIAFLSSACLVTAAISASAAAVTEEAAEFKPETGYAELSCVSPDGEGAYVTVVVTKPDSSLFYVGEAQTDTNGRADFKIKMNMDGTTADVSGSYGVSFGGANMDKSPAKSYIFINTKDSGDILSAVNGKPEGTDMTQVITAGLAAKCGIETGEGSVFYGVTDKAAVYAAMTDRSFASAYELKSEFEKAAILQSVKEKGSVELIIQHAKTMGLDISADSSYGKLSASAQSRVCENLTKAEFSLRDTSAVQTAFNKAVYVEMVNELGTSDRSKLIDYIEECNTLKYTDISLAEYNSSELDETDRLNVIKKVLASKDSVLFDDLGDIASAFSDAVDAVIEENEEAEEEASSNRHNSSGGGGGGGGKTLYVPTVKNDTAADDKEDTSHKQESAPAFNDLETVPWAEEAIGYLASKGILNGDGKGGFAPDRAITREEFVKMLVTALNIPKEETENRFSDVPGDAWYYESVMRAYACGLVTGIDGERFGVGMPITREQLCTIVFRAINLLDINIESEPTAVVLSDKDSISEYAVEAVEAMYRAEIVNGMGDGSFAPKQTATRAMAAKIIYLVLERGNLL